MQYLIDGYNLIYADSALASLMDDYMEEARERLMNKLYVFCSHGKHKSTVVFDGKAGIPYIIKHPPGIQVIFTRGIDADRQIRKMIEAANNPAHLTVVTSDYKDIGHYAEICGAALLRSDQFLDQLEKFESRNRGEPEKPETVTAEEVGYWLKRFGERRSE